MGCCASKTTAGAKVTLEEAAWDGGYDPVSWGLEVCGVPLDNFLQRVYGLSEADRGIVLARIVEVAQEEMQGVVQEPVSPVSSPRRDVSDLSLGRDISCATNTSTDIKGGLSGSLASNTSKTSKFKRSAALRRSVVKTKSVHVGLLSWNVGGISDNRKEAGSGVEESAREAVGKVLDAVVKDDFGECDIVVVGLQEVISLTASNAIQGLILGNEGGTAVRTANGVAVGVPETVAHWVDLIVSSLNREVPRHSITGRDRSWSGGRWQPQQTPDDETDIHQLDARNFTLYGQPVYLFGMLLCVFCRTNLVRAIKDFSLVTKPLDEENFKPGAKGAVACRFVLHDRSFCFLNCHLAAQKVNSHKDNEQALQRRLTQLERCWEEIKFVSSVDQVVYPVAAHRAIFLMGDLNMRLDLRVSEAPSLERRLKDAGNVNVEELVKELWAIDQLHHRKRKHNLVRIGSNMDRVNGVGEHAMPVWQKLREPWEESAEPPFQPTYKLEVPGPAYSKKRLPGWTDRVLYRSQHAQPTKYSAVRQMNVLTPPRNISDHDPIFATFDVECRAISLPVVNEFVREARKSAQNGQQSATDANAYAFLAEQSNLRAAVFDSAEPELEELSRRVSESLRDLDVASLTVGTQQLVDFQAACWSSVCERLAADMTAAILTAQVRLTSGSSLKEELLAQALRNLERTMDESRGDITRDRVVVVTV